MKAEIIAVGSELLLGQIANTNGQYVSRVLADLGVDVFYHAVVGDNRGRLLETLQTASHRSALVIITGGLGPTKDDLTKETVASFINDELVIHEESLEAIRAFFSRRNVAMTENNRKQALVLKHSTVFKNEHGMAPGMGVTHNGTTYILLPGPPTELKPMVTNYVVPYLRAFTGSDVIKSRVLRYFGIGESKLETELLDLIEQQSNPTIAPLAGDGEVTLRLTVKHKHEEEGDRLLDELQQTINDRVGDYCYGEGERPLQQLVIETLTGFDLTLASAESLTGGLFGAKMSEVVGASSCYRGTVTAYSNYVKEEILQVPSSLLQKEGAISFACAEAMAVNVKARTGASVAISFTGVAGPDDAEGHPPGTVFVGLSIEGCEPTVIQLALQGSRQSIRERAVKHGMIFILKEIKRWNEKRNDVF